jgi:hypothetical protein
MAVMTRQRATDRVSQPTSYRRNPETGVVEVSGKLTRPGLLIYGPTEFATGRTTVVYRSVAAISDPAYIASIKGSMVSPDHTFRNVGKGGSGVVTAADYAGGYVNVSLMLTDPKVISRIQQDRELSAGYEYVYQPMTASQIAQAKLAYADDWEGIAARLNGRAVDWVMASDLRNNHVTVVPQGRAGVTCSIDGLNNGENMLPVTTATDNAAEAPLGEIIPVEGEIALDGCDDEATDEAATADKATQMMMQLLDMITSIKDALGKTGVAFDGQAFAADRAGYMAQTLEGIRVVATDADLSQSMALVHAYCVGFDAGTTQKATKPKAPIAIQATDEAIEVEGPPVVVATTRNAWDRLTQRITTNKEGK